MTKEQIIDTLWHLGFQFDGDKAVIDKHTMETSADTLLAEIEQEKKRLLLEITAKIQHRGGLLADAGEIDIDSGNKLFFMIIEMFEKEYGVEL